MAGVTVYASPPRLCQRRGAVSPVQICLTQCIHLLLSDSQLPHKNLQRLILICNSKQYVDNLVGGVDISKQNYRYIVSDTNT